MFLVSETVLLAKSSRMRSLIDDGRRPGSLSRILAATPATIAAEMDVPFPFLPKKQNTSDSGTNLELQPVCIVGYGACRLNCSSRSIDLDTRTIFHRHCFTSLIASTDC